ncbi:MAG: hypothetical protein GF364_19445, partial [Candidatus Lokiarchaeota archaeon]|nr:hypothetical protein [Candidatus Lokiarchaeota archaeon]
MRLFFITEYEKAPLFIINKHLLGQLKDHVNQFFDSTQFKLFNITTRSTRIKRSKFCVFKKASDGTEDYSEYIMQSLNNVKTLNAQIIKNISFHSPYIFMILVIEDNNPDLFIDFLKIVVKLMNPETYNKIVYFSVFFLHNEPDKPDKQIFRVDIKFIEKLFNRDFSEDIFFDPNYEVFKFEMFKNGDIDYKKITRHFQFIIDKMCEFDAEIEAKEFNYREKLKKLRYGILVDTVSNYDKNWLFLSNWIIKNIKGKNKRPYPVTVKTIVENIPKKHLEITLENISRSDIIEFVDYIDIHSFQDTSSKKYENYRNTEELLDVLDASKDLSRLCIFRLINTDWIWICEIINKQKIKKKESCCEDFIKQAEKYHSDIITKETDEQISQFIFDSMRMKGYWIFSKKEMRDKSLIKQQTTEETAEKDSNENLDEKIVEEINESFIITLDPIPIDKQIRFTDFFESLDNLIDNMGKKDIFIGVGTIKDGQPIVVSHQQLYNKQDIVTGFMQAIIDFDKESGNFLPRLGNLYRLKKTLMLRNMYEFEEEIKDKNSKKQKKAVKASVILLGQLRENFNTNIINDTLKDEIINNFNKTYERLTSRYEEGLRNSYSPRNLDRFRWEVFDLLNRGQTKMEKLTELIVNKLGFQLLNTFRLKPPATQNFHLTHFEILLYGKLSQLQTTDNISILDIIEDFVDETINRKFLLLAALDLIDDGILVSNNDVIDVSEDRWEEIEDLPAYKEPETEISKESEEIEDEGNATIDKKEKENELEEPEFSFSWEEIE